jgi:hypothetical protein
VDAADDGTRNVAGLFSWHEEIQIHHSGEKIMKRFFAAYEPTASEYILVFTVVVRDEAVAHKALLAMRGACPLLRWTEHSGLFSKDIAPQSPFEFLPSAV